MPFAGPGGRTKRETHMISAGMLERGGSSVGWFRDCAGTVGLCKSNCKGVNERQVSLGNEREANRGQKSVD
jgi:hypothetical protein